MRKQTKLVAVLSAAALLAIGASMTSFAATKGWVQEGEDWVYLDSDGNREANVWRRSGDNYYWLDDEGLMARNALVKDDTVDAIYYVDENGVRVVNAWKQLPNDDGAQVGSENTDDTPSVLYYYFGSSGKAFTAAGEDKKVREIDGKYYMFNEEGQMLSGWQKSGKNEDLYYLGTETEGWARTDWQHLEPNDAVNSEDYDELEWFYFGSNGKATKSKSKYIDGRYYHFDENGIMDDDWYSDLGTVPTAASGATAFADLYGSKTGWIYSGDADVDAETRYDNDDMYWYYLVNVRGSGKIARSVPFNYQVTKSGSVTDATSETNPDGFVRTLVIKNKTYIFNSDGKMLKGFVVIGDAKDDGKKNVNLDVEGAVDNNTPTDYDRDPVGLKNKDDKYVAFNNVADTKNAYNRTVVEQGHFAGKDKPYGYTYMFKKVGDYVTDEPTLKLANKNSVDYVEGQVEAANVKDALGQPVTGSTTLLNGLYYFSEAGGSLDGQMQTGRTAITKDGETYYYYFSKDSTYPGYAYTNAIQDGYLYGSDGRCIMADSGNSYALYELSADTLYMAKKDPDNAKKPLTIEAGASVIVSRTGKVKTSGTVTIDGVKYVIDSKNATVDWDKMDN